LYQNHHSVFFGFCDPADNRVKIVNDSNSAIYYFYSCDSSLLDLDIFRTGYYSDSKGPTSLVTSDQFIEKRSALNLIRRGDNAWMEFFNSCENKRIHFFIFTDSTVNNHSDSEIKYKMLFDKHLTFTLDELEKEEWIIRYQ